MGLFGDILGAGAGIFGAMEQADAAHEANQVARDNLNFQRDAFNKQFAAQTDPVTDIRGNRVTYVPGVGWRTIASPTSQQLINATDAENLKLLTDDAALARSGRVANALRRRQEGNAADKVLSQINAGSPYGTPQQFQSALLRSKFSGLNNAYNSALNSAIRQSVRAGGSSNMGNQLSKFAQRMGQDYNNAASDAYTQGAQEYEALNGARTSRLGNLYNVLASRAANVGNAPFVPSSIPAETLATQKQQSAGIDNLANNAYPSSIASGTLANTALKQGSSLMDLFNKIGVAGSGLFTALSQRQNGNTFSNPNATDYSGLAGYNAGGIS